MEDSYKKENKEVNEEKTFSIPSSLEKIKENISISNNTPYKPSKEQIIKQAFQFHSEGNISEASKYYQYFINQGFKDHRVFSNYGSILKDLAKLKEAEISTRKAIELNPNFSNAHYNLGNILSDLGQLKEAEISTRKAIELNPNFSNAHYSLGNILNNLGQLKEAEISLRKAIELNPNNANAHYNLGNILSELGKKKETEISLRKAIELNPELAQAHSNLGRILKDTGNLQEAEILTRKAIDLKPDLAEAHSNLGQILNDLGILQDAENSTRKAIELNPDFAEAYLNLSMIELLKGNYQSGLDNYEFRFKVNKPNLPHGLTKMKRRDSSKLQKEEKILVITEQGLGDTIQYMRYIPYLKNQGFNISFCAQTKLHRLIQASGIEKNPLTPEQASQVSEGTYIPLLSLPRYLKVSPNNPIISEPYIFPTNELKKKWKKILSIEKKPIIGINWQGNPAMEKINYKGRSIPLETFSMLFDRNDIRMLSLQKGFGSEQLDHCSFRNKFVKSQPIVNSTWDFLENAAIIENCDLIITCDTSIAHLAGGMGKKVWLLLRDIPFWTWGLEKENTFWYPSIRLFRQKIRHNWNEVMERVAKEIKNL
ncbi:tetratricopeptide repeat protein [Prochlorococcus sp. MIT 0801]|uniref:tetratricopeptide repeat protein n=1 Tax=Prochlorococcus sp. MIT 0801 TaxID=1501269 RepID=UPI0004F68177|nr:tetratricopeptide repeat protein [Prochlorococcus sp. MIT 0801]AIQ98126.1 Translation elongation factor P [Prochlorococcus sp. MIT 0801]